jgi:nucleoside-diphosphate-sugar epimerase
MKKILITGKNSYVGKNLERWLGAYPDKYIVDSISLRDYSWKAIEFSKYDVVFHVAGIAHIKETSDNQDLYYNVNRDLAYEIAQKAKSDGVGQFVFLSSMSVYGIENGVINKNTPLKPNSAYGKSKIEAEELINKIKDDSFIVATLRPPMVYGRGCRGNYPKLAKLALKTPMFPNVDNKRSMIYIDNLSEFVKQLIDNQGGGLFFPQNAEYVNTSEMVRMIAEVHGKRVLMTKLFNPLLRLLNVSTVNKVFGNLVYDMSMSGNINLVPFSETIKQTENK